MPTDARDPIHLPAEFWDRDDVCAALAARDMGTLFRLVRQYSGASQTRIGIVAGMAQSYVSDIVRGRTQVMAHDVFVRIAGGLHMPDAARARLGLAPIPGRGSGAGGLSLTTAGDSWAGDRLGSWRSAPGWS
ncbi:helix-turn-helix domain-containing protein [Dactylosporangium sp. NPDC051485]|uniref:helix-turn-helix domain-containing protein n=1 Tax=Dactylosporangium sp. NPDC051485 TaxID=3154846 RepID=UPI0034333C9F